MHKQQKERRTHCCCCRSSAKRGLTASPCAAACWRHVLPAHTHAHACCASGPAGPHCQGRHVGATCRGRTDGRTHNRLNNTSGVQVCLQQRLVVVSKGENDTVLARSLLDDVCTCRGWWQPEWSGVSTQRKCVHRKTTPRLRCRFDVMHEQESSGLTHLSRPSSHARLLSGSACPLAHCSRSRCLTARSRCSRSAAACRCRSLLYLVLTPS